MAAPIEQDDASPPPPGLRVGCWASLAMLVLLAAGFAILWFNRERIADDYIADQLEAYGIEATYRIEQLLTLGDGATLYKVRHENEPFDRVVSERDLGRT